MKPDEAIKRSIDSLQRLYAVIAALAVGEALRRTVLKGNGAAHSVQISWSDWQLPLCVVMLVTAIPFVHGMNRHLDDHIDSLNRNNRGRMIFMLVLDFFVFVFECCLLFVLGSAVDGSRITFCRILLWLLLTDMAWAILRVPLEKDEDEKDEDEKDEQEKGEDEHDPAYQELLWAFINFVAAGCVLYLSGLAASDLLVGWLLAIMAILRTAADYGFGRNHYFPPASKNA